MNSYNLISFITIFTNINKYTNNAHNYSNFYNNTTKKFHYSYPLKTALLTNKKTYQNKQNTNPYNLNINIHKISIFKILYNLLYYIKLNKFLIIYYKNL